MGANEQHDVVIIGGGVAGLIAANRAAQLGMTVIVLEKGTAEKYLCNTRFTGGSLHICHRDIMGATNPANADAGTIRKELAESIEANSVHGSDSEENAATEIAYFFKPEEIVG